MSRAGKFIPGGKGGGDAPGAGRTGPIRAPEPGTPGPDPPGKKPAPGIKASLVKPVQKNQRQPIMIMSALVCTMLVSFAWYEFAVVPARNAVAAANQTAADLQKQLADEKAAAEKQAEEDAKNAAQARATLTVDTTPTGASATIGSEQKITPATFTDIIPGKVTLVLHADGYEDATQQLTLTADKPTDLGTVALVQEMGSLSLSSEQSDVQYNLTGPGGYSHDGQVPDKLDSLPAGNYQLIASMNDWKLAPITITVHDKESVQKEIKFPFGDISITTVPAGATVRNGRTILGQTPLSLNRVRPGEMHLAIDLPPYTIQRFSLTVPEGGSVSKQIVLQQGKDFIAACGMPMVWIPDGGFWAGKYDVRQSEFELVAAYNPSTFRRPNRPVETIDWEDAMAFCEKLTAYERKAGKLPAGYKYTLPMESQWSTFSADADIEQAAMSRTSSLSSTQDVGASEPNKYGLYDTLGNVWEWCFDAYDNLGNHSLRGGSWLSSPSNFPNADTRQGAPPKYSDKFTGFRVVLVPQ